MDDREFSRAIEDFKNFERAGAIAAAPQEFCTVYKKVKPILKGIEPFIKLIPIWGATAAEAIDLLTTALDKACP